MPSPVTDNNMARNRANAKRKTDDNTKKPPGKAPRTNPVISADLKNPPPTTTPAATAAESDASAATSRTINTLPSTSPLMLPSSVNVPVLGGSGDHETANEELTKATTAATTAAFSGIRSPADWE